MTTDDKKVENIEKPKPSPDEQTGFVLSSGIKIFDPNTSEIFVQKRGDD